jgi:hypothetical protein
VSKIIVPKIIREMPLSDYAPEMSAYALQVWVNPPREVIRRFNLIMSTGDTSELFAGQTAAPAISVDDQVSQWYSDILSQGEPERRMSSDDLKALFDEDPALWSFISSRVWQMFEEHREALQKKQAKP